MMGEEKKFISVEDWSDPKEPIDHDIKSLVLELSKEVFLHEQGVISAIRASQPFKYRYIEDMPSLANQPTKFFTALVTIDRRRRVVRVSYAVEPDTDRAYIEHIQFDTLGN